MQRHGAPAQRSPGDGSANGKRPLWHEVTPAEVSRRVGVDPDEGLEDAEVRRRLDEQGRNRLPERKKVHPFVRFLAHFHNVLIYVLLFAAAGTAALRLWVDTGVIVAVVVINSAIGFIQEGKAEKSLEAIRKMLSPKAVALRDGRRQSIDAEELVVGDIVFLTPGDRVPADLRVLDSKNLRVDEAVLTGESVPVDKDPEPVTGRVELGDRTSMAFSGTLVTRGHGKGVVVATGCSTQIGQISTMLGEVETLTTPLLREIARFGRWLSVAIVFVSGLAFAVGYWIRDYALVEVFLAAVSIAVAAIPEGLPAIMTITLAIGVQRMAARNAIIRRLPAVETLGAVTVIYSDKTGTLTRNEMTVTRVSTADQAYDVTGSGYEPRGGFELDGHDVSPDEDPVLLETLRGGVLCNDAQVRLVESRWQMEGDPTEGALVTAAIKAGFDPDQLSESRPRTDVIPFDASHQFMATLHHDHEGHAFIYVKGAPERVTKACRTERTGAGDRPLRFDAWEHRMRDEAARGQRLLAIARKEVEPDHGPLTFDHVEDLTLIGMVGITDPPRDEAIAAIDDCKRAGIAVKMITGDHAITAGAIARQLGIGGTTQVVTGAELEAADDEALEALVGRAHVFARATPKHKLCIVRAVQSKNQVVAMTGDGVNDAPALKRADVGIAMGIKGTEAAKEASEMVLADDNFASIAHAVEVGRTVYDNLRKTILFLLPTNGAQALTIIAAISLGLSLPLSPLQVLWVNMVTAVTLSLALAFEPTEPGVMTRRPRDPSSPILSGFLAWRVLYVAIVLVAGTFGHFLWLEQRGVATDMARTMAINTLVAGQLFYLFNSRYVVASSFTTKVLFGNRILWITIAALAVLQLLFTYTSPFHVLFGTAAIGLGDWGRVLAFGVVVFVLVELEKAVIRLLVSRRDRRERRDAPAGPRAVARAT
jgi:magnesium-transporting ATPase (P-type)